MSDQTTKPHADPVTEARRREMATEHLLFGTMRFLARRHPDLLDELEGSLAHLWDTVEGEARDDEAVRTIARRILKGLRAEQ
ncbi:hypothetical protein ABID82_001130 [Methylobacterium sp. PvP062]|jgi:hypothetical protein|uniref:Uncharacterized protein n=2 Tax=Methylobacterium radiotolerans TaxID=31998 RepID=B1LSZ1_METRJ|nr:MULTISPECIES: hypothetical protein [Methylobacterium]MCX7334942.1 hypothetical protein [Hyphomicrobiales bacterium]GAN49430.1 hypothetical protein ME121_3458 [Methylobacterium sp. ME121]ACB26862.1 conserved hypothetical protein [Methylobacterium radiotolerans JCM 2831]KZC02766.1 hypothetical protein AU375_01018 [Methylobacterium radiotolerans]MBN6821373.1 hypothetical protein [Methylobacterium organophilum]